MNSTVKVALLVVVIVACLGYIVFRTVGGKKSGAAGAEAIAERDMYCVECKSAYKATIDESEYMPLMMAGASVNPKHTCPNCGKAGGIGGLKCAACGEVSPSPGMQAMMPGPSGRPKGVNCPKCKKPLPFGAAGPSAGAGPAGAPPAQ